MYGFINACTLYDAYWCVTAQPAHPNDSHWHVHVPLAGPIAEGNASSRRRLRQAQPYEVDALSSGGHYVRVER